MKIQKYFKSKKNRIDFLKVCLIVFATNTVLGWLQGNGDLLTPIIYPKIGLMYLNPLMIIIQLLGVYYFFWGLLSWIMIALGPILNYFIAIKLYPEVEKLMEQKLTKDNKGANIEIDLPKNTEIDLLKKYKILTLYRNILYVLMGIITLAMLWFLSIDLADKVNYMSEAESAIFNSQLKSLYIISYSISMFSIYCAIKVIEFLFDLEKYKKNK